MAIFKDRVDIYNPGVFPEELSPGGFYKGDGYSILRNPLVAETMYMSADIEKWASGLKRIYDECIPPLALRLSSNALKPGSSYLSIALNGKRAKDWAMVVEK